MIPTLARQSLFAVPALAGLLLAGCSNGDSTPPTSEATPGVADTSAAPPPYPLDTCVVSGEKLGTMGEVYEVEVEGRTVKLCCAGCEDQLRAEPAKYLAMLDDATANVHPNDDGHGHDQHDH
jgi:hypothetical protein